MKEINIPMILSLTMLRTNVERLSTESFLFVDHRAKFNGFYPNQMYYEINILIILDDGYIEQKPLVLNISIEISYCQPLVTEVY